MNTFTIGVDLGGTSLRAGAYSSTWQQLAYISIPTRVSDGPDAVVSDIVETVRAVLDQCSGHVLDGIGVGCPGPLELPAGRLCHLPNFPGWDGFALKDALQSALRMPITLDCDANAAALGEWTSGAGDGCAVDSLCMLTLGTGVGSGIILERKIWHGLTGMGGEAGHVSVEPSGPACGCGGRGCLEVYASATGLCRMAREMLVNGCTPALTRLAARKPSFEAKDIASLADDGDTSAIKLFEALGRFLGLGLAGLVNTLNLPLFVIGGGLASAWNLFAPAMFQTLRHYSYVYRLSEPAVTDLPGSLKTHVVPGRLGATAGLVGAAMLPRCAASADRIAAMSPIRL